MSSAAGQLEASLAHADMLSASENAPAKRARVAVDARGDSGESQWADRRGGQSAAAGSAVAPHRYWSKAVAAPTDTGTALFSMVCGQERAGRRKGGKEEG